MAYEVKRTQQAATRHGGKNIKALVDADLVKRKREFRYGDCGGSLFLTENGRNALLTN